MRADSAVFEEFRGCAAPRVIAPILANIRRFLKHQTIAYNFHVLLCVSSSHKTASFPVLERLASAGDASSVFTARSEFFDGAVVVATCNRFEAYLDVDQPERTDPRLAIEAAWRALSAHTGLPYETLRENSEVRLEDDVVEHLFSVSSGLESLVVGETEISGQVADALLRARSAGTTTAVLERLFQNAAKTSREVKNGTDLVHAGRSLVRLALDMCDTRIADWSALRVLLIGTGQYARVTVAALRDHGVRDIAVHSASGRAKAFAAHREVRAVDPAQLDTEIASADVIVTCTTAPHTVLDKGGLQHARSRAVEATTASTGPAPCPQLPARQLIIDLGMPRNVALDVSELPDVDLLDLETIKLHAPLEQLASADNARAVVEAATTSFHQQRNQQRVGRALGELKQRFFAALDEEISRSTAHEPSHANTEKALRHLVGVLLNEPMQQARAMAAEDRQGEFVDALSAIYGIEVPEDDLTAGCGRCPIAHQLETRRDDSAGEGHPLRDAS